MKKIFLFLCVLPQVLWAQVEAVTGRWDGEIEVQGIKFGFKTQFTKNADQLEGSLDIPSQGAFGLPLNNVALEGNKLRFDLKTNGGTAFFRGEQKGDKVEGSFEQGSVSGTFFMDKWTQAKQDAYWANLPYEEEEVQFTNGDFTLAGTLSKPKNVKNPAVLVLVSGSGPQDRDSNILGFSVFGTMADFFCRKGMAVLRYDDRGVAKSGGKGVMESTTLELASDAKAAVQYLLTRKDVNTKAIGLLGHSEGGIIAPIVANQVPELAFVVLMAGTGVSGYDIILEQSQAIMKADGASKEQLSKALSQNKKMYKAVMSNKGLDKIKEAMTKDAIANFPNLLPAQKEYFQNDPNFYAKEMVNAQIAQVTTPWMKFFLSYNPIVELEKLTKPSLLLFGEKDLQVLPSQNKQPMLNALAKAGNKQFDFKVFASANHLFQKANTGSPTEYVRLQKQFVDGFLDYVYLWMAKYTKS